MIVIPLVNSFCGLLNHTWQSILGQRGTSTLCYLKKNVSPSDFQGLLNVIFFVNESSSPNSGIGIFLDDEFKGSSYACDTYGNPPLFPASTDFECAAVEAYSCE